MKSFGGAQGIVRVVWDGRSERIVRLIPIRRIEYVVVALMLFIEAEFGWGGSGEEEETEESDHQHGEPLKSGAAREQSLFPC